MRALIGLGSNLGEREYFLQKSLELLATRGYPVKVVSSVYASEPIEGCTLPFLNACAIVQCHASAEVLMKDLLDVEKELGRVRMPSRKDRCIDLDILLLRSENGEAVVHDDALLRVPHPRMLERDFVLVPACEIAADWVLRPGYKDCLGDFLKPAVLPKVPFQLRCP